MSKEIFRKQKKIVAEFDALPDVDAKYAYLFQLAENMPERDPGLKTDANLVNGCQSALWCRLDCHDGRVYLAADSESLVIKGIAALLFRVINGSRPSEVERLNLEFIDQLRIWKLPSKRNNSLMAMLDHIKAQARDLQQNLNSTSEGPGTCQD